MQCGHESAAAAHEGFGDEFEQRIESHRTELLAHCYRMLASVQDAEDLVQDTYLRAWRAREQYDPERSALRTWLYRIATNACLTALEGRARRPLPSLVVAAAEPLDALVHGGEATWLQPMPAALLGFGGAPGEFPVDRGSVRLAFVAALQHLSSRQRAVLILREVLAFSAAEAASILDTSVASINSNLQRARARLKEAGVQEERVPEPAEAEQRVWVERYMTAFVAADIDGLKKLIAEDVLMEMPPMTNWFIGRENYAAFMAWVFEKAGSVWRLVPTGANGQPAFAAYRLGERGTYELHTLQVFDVGHDGIVRNSVFQDDDVFAAFGLAAELEA